MPLLCLVCFWGCGHEACAQAGFGGLTNWRSRRLVLQPEPQRLDSVLVVPGSVVVLGPAWAKDSVRVHLDSAGRLTLLNGTTRWGDTVEVGYRVFPLRGQQSFVVADLRGTASSGMVNRPSAGAGAALGLGAQATSPFTLRGYVARETAVAQQNSIPSGGRMDLTLEGQFGNGISLHGELLSQSLPFQPDGTTADVKALDRVYLRVGTSRWSVEGGDIAMQGAGRFLVHNRQAQGLLYRYRGEPGQLDSLTVETGGGVAKGEYVRVTLQGSEGVQGPYRLSGARGFVQSVILAASERVFVDGVLVQRGQEHDYTIDYNLGEIFFTARCRIRAASRIVVEYQLVERHFTRYMGQARVSLGWRNGWWGGVRVYASHDASSSLQGVTDAPGVRSQLAELGKGVTQAWVVPTVPTLNGRERDGYRLADTLIEGRRYTFFRYVAAGQQDSLFDVPFSYVGRGQGEYMLTQRENNSQVFEWVGPAGRNASGDYRAGQLVRTPQSHEVVEMHLGRTWQAGQGQSRITVAYSHRTQNTLAVRQAPSNHGVAVETAHEGVLVQQAGGRLTVGGRMRWVSHHFQQVERFWAIDYFRDWGLEDTPVRAGHWADGEVWAEHTDRRGAVRLGVEGLGLGHRYGGRVSLRTAHRWGHTFMEHRAAYARLRDSGRVIPTGRMHSVVGREWGRVRISVFGDGELQRAMTGARMASTSAGSWWRAGSRAEWLDTGALRLVVESAYREDWRHGAAGSPAKQRGVETRFSLGTQWASGGQLGAELNWRFAVGPLSTANPTRHSVLAHVSVRQPLAQQRIVLSVEQDLGAERSARWQQHFVRVPTGQGQYAWVDSNGDGVPQVEEFVRAQFRDQGNYVLQLVPSSEGVLSLSHSLRADAQLSVRPFGRPIARNTVWWERWDGLLSSYTQRKRSDGRWGELLVPLRGQTQEGLLENVDRLEGTVRYNWEAWPAGVAYAYRYSRARMSLAQGQSVRGDTEHKLSVGTPSGRGWSGLMEGAVSRRRDELPYRGQQVSALRVRHLQLTCRWEGEKGLSHEVRGEWLWILAQGTQLGARLQEYAYQLRIPLGERWEGNAHLRYAYLRSQLEGNSPLLYEVLRGMGPGANVVAEMGVRCKVNRYLEVGVQYAFRSLSLGTPVHSGSLQLRANFY